MFDVIIIGAGFAGAVMAERLASEQGRKVLVVERRSHIGGNCHDRRDENGILIHTYGPHLFHTDDVEVWEYLSRFTAWDVYQHRVLAVIDGKKVPIPFNLDTLYEVFPESMAGRMEAALLESYAYNTKVPILQLKQSANKDLQFLADFVYEKIFLHYTEKQWGMKPEDIDGAVTARVPVFIGRDGRYFNERFQAVPTHGYTELFRKLLAHPSIKLMLNTSFHDIMSIRDNRIFFLDQPFHGKVIYTGMLDELFDYELGELPYRSVRMSFETVKQESYQEAATVNYPNNYTFTRITEFKKIHPADTRNTTILKEYPQAYVRGENTPYYPVFTEETRGMYAKYQQKATHVPQLALLGRLAEYRYYDMDDIVKAALEQAKER
ncbi:MAG: UDP-galactopyranose mutase [Selenomonadaceae bacterium]|nr:UDP-galactopyranose mutase [Selenomonadaceae bacterium]